MTPNGGEPGATALPGASGWARFTDGARVQYATPVGVASGAARPAPRAGAAGWAPDTDGAFAFALFTTMLFIPQLGTIGAVLFVTLTGAYAALSWNRLYAVLRPRAFLLIIPFVCVFSTVWSEHRSETLRYATEFGITIAVALLLSDARRPKAVLLGMFVAFTGYMLASIAFGQLVKVGIDGTYALAGLNNGKNLLADTASVGLLTTIAVFFTGIEDRKLLRSLLAIVAGGAQIYALVGARSAGAMLGLGLGVCAFLFLLALRHSALVVRATVTCILGLGVIAASLFYRTLSGALIDAGARFFDKDPTLTGRTYLWQRAADLIAEKPVFGKGFSAFWVQGNTDAEGLWRYAHIAQREGFNFHNTFIDLMVQVGWFGLVVIVAVIVVAIICLIRRFVAQPSIALCFWLSLLVYELVRTPIEYIGFTEFYYASVMVFIALGSAFATQQPDPRQFARKAPQRSSRNRNGSR